MYLSKQSVHPSLKYDFIWLRSYCQQPLPAIQWQPSLWLDQQSSSQRSHRSLSSIPQKYHSIKIFCCVSYSVTTKENHLYKHNACYYPCTVLHMILVQNYKHRTKHFIRCHGDIIGNQSLLFQWVAFIAASPTAVQGETEGALSARHQIQSQPHLPFFSHFLHRVCPHWLPEK